MPLKDLGIAVLSIDIVLISMAVSHTFLDFITYVYLGAPNPDTALSILPAHRLLLEGKGHEAVQLATIGSLFGLIITILMTPLLVISVAKFYPIINLFIPYILGLASLFLTKSSL